MAIPMSPSPTPAPSDASTNGSTSRPKRIRLSLACNQCRKRKVRCDTEQPKCRNCWLRDEVCETTDPRYPDNGPSVRRWATKDGLLPGQNPAATHRNQSQIPKHSVPTAPAPAPAPPPPPPPPPPPTVPLDHVQGANDQNHQNLGRGDPIPRRWSISASATAAPADASTPQRNASSTSPATAAGSAVSSTAQATAADAAAAAPAIMSWVSRGYQDSISAGGGGEMGANDGEPDLIVNTESGSSLKVKYMGGSSVQCLSAFVNIYLRRKGLPPISSHFQSGMRHVEEFELPLTTLVPALPDPASLATHLDTFFRKIWPVYPVVDRATVEANVQSFQRAAQSSSSSSSSSTGGLRANLTASQVPQLATVYAIITIGADEDAGQPTDLGTTYLNAAYSLFAHLVAMPYLTSVQALFLLSVALRGRCKDGQAWHVLAQAIRVAHSIGLHRYIRPSQSRPSSSVESNPPPPPPDADLHMRVWWSCYALEKLMELETGRPSAISDQDIDQMLPPAESVRADGSPDFFALWIALARILSQISQQIYRRRPASAWQLMFDTGRLDEQLMEWANALPDSIKPGHELFAGHELGQGGPYEQHISSFLSLQYYQAQITLLRASLVFPSQSYVDEVKRLGPSLPSYARLLQSENICTAAARATARQVLELVDLGIQSLLLSGTQLFLTVVVLALHIVKNPRRRLVRSDIELLITATEHLETLYTRGGQHPNFVRGFETLRTSVLAAANLEQRPPAQAPTTTTTMTTPASASETGPELPVVHGDEDPLAFFGDPSLVVPGIMLDNTSFLMGDEIPLEELWGAIGNCSFLEPGTGDHPLPGP